MTEAPKSKEQEKLELVKRLQQKAYMQQCLPHLYGFPWYQWAWEFFNSRNRFNFLVAANQVSKSSTQIRKCIHWATEEKLWPTLWPIAKPTQFWYFYPSKDVATIEFKEKWVKEFLPRNEYKNHEKYGWQEEIVQKQIYAIHFNSGISVYFKSYEQDLINLQASTVFAMFLDEECPYEMYPELVMRLSAVDGYFHMVFTATLGQEYWRETMEEKGKNERFPNAFKKNISLYECQQYMDGTPSPWNIARIKEKEANCGTEVERLRRIMGRFVKDTDLKYAGFDRKVNLIDDHKLPANWLTYTGVDVGSGGTSNHPAAIVFIGVSPDFTKGRIYKTWRGDGEVTTASDVYQKYKEMKGKIKPVAQYYDWASKDFSTISERAGESFQPADKTKDSGEKLLNALFKTEMLKIYKTDDSMKLVHELENLSNKTHKVNAKDDLTDALRYAATRIPWDFSAINGPKLKGKDPYEGLTERQANYLKEKKDRNSGIHHLIDQEEFEEWNHLYDNLGYE